MMGDTRLGADGGAPAQPLPPLKPRAWLCEFAEEDGTTRTQFVEHDPAGLRWNDAGEPSPYRTTPLYMLPRWWRCNTHGPAKANAWGCPECVVELRRWKSTHAPRLTALVGLLEAAQMEAHAGREAMATLASERAANALLTGEVERLRAAIERACAGYPAGDAAAPTCVAILRGALGGNAEAEPARPAERMT